MREYYDARTFDQTQGSRSCEKAHIDALIKGMMTVHITIHDKMSASWKKGVGRGKLREIVRTKYGMNCHRFYTKFLHEME